MFDGQGCGEWNALHCSDKTLCLRFQHLLQPLDCAATGFSHNADKHMRPANVAQHSDYMHHVSASSTQWFSPWTANPVHITSSLAKACYPHFHLDSAVANDWYRKSAGGTVAQLFSAGHLGSHFIQFVRCHNSMLNDDTATCDAEVVDVENSKLDTRILAP